MNWTEGVSLKQKGGFYFFFNFYYVYMSHLCLILFGINYSFRSDIRLMRSRLRDLERGFTKINARPSTTSSVSRSMATESASVNTGLVSSARDTVERARQLEQELKLIHSRVMSLESELKLTGNDE